MENVKEYNFRKLGPKTYDTKRTRVSLFKLHPNDRQPRPDWNKPDPELQRQILANEGLWEPILVERMTSADDEYQIIDGHRRWFNSKELVEVNGLKEYEVVPVEIIDEALGQIERVTAWIFIHRQRREWDTLVQEGVAYTLVNLVGRAKAADVLGLPLTRVDELTQIYELAKDKFSAVGEAAISWAREVNSLSAKLRTQDVVNAIVQKVNLGILTNSREIRYLRKILKDDQAQEEFFRDGGTILSALAKLSETIEPPRVGKGFTSDLDALAGVLRGYSWSALNQASNDPQFLKKLDEVETLIQDLRASAGLTSRARKRA